MLQRNMFLGNGAELSALDEQLTQNEKEIEDDVMEVVAILSYAENPEQIEVLIPIIASVVGISVKFQEKGVQSSRKKIIREINEMMNRATNDHLLAIRAVLRAIIDTY